jgi:perosamine synthetase
MARLPYARHWIDDDDVAEVVAVLRSDWLTTGPAVEVFERAVAQVAGGEYGVAVANGTAALHLAAAAAGVGIGDEVIVPCLTFAATANAAVYQGAVPVFVDVDPETLLVDPAAAERAITQRTRAIIAVDFAGQPCDYDALTGLARRHGLALVADAAHSLGARDHGRPVGSLAPLTTFSFHPVKHITTGEGGMIVTNDEASAVRMRRLRNHGMTLDARERERSRSYAYDVAELGYNYRLSDLQCALGVAQLRRLPWFLERRRAIARRYREQLADAPGVTPLAERPGVEHAYHLFVVRVDPAQSACDRDAIFDQLAATGIQANVHYRPVHLHSFYRDRFGTHAGLCPAGERAGEDILSLPMFPRMTDADVDRVAEVVRRAAAGAAAAHWS